MRQMKQMLVCTKSRNGQVMGDKTRAQLSLGLPTVLMVHTRNLRP